MPTTFDLTLAEPYSCGIGASLAIWDFSGGPAQKAPVTVEPGGLSLYPNGPTAETVTLTVTPDADTIDARYKLEAYVIGTIGGLSPEWEVQVIDGDPDPI